MIRRLALAAALLLGCLPSARAAIGFSPGKPMGFCQFTPSVATTLLAGCGAVPVGANYVLITVENTGVRYRDDGTAPTATIGFLIPPGGVLVYSTTNLLALQLIQIAAGSTVDVAFYRQTS